MYSVKAFLLIHIGGPIEIKKADKIWPAVTKLEAFSRTVFTDYNKLVSSEPEYIWVFCSTDGFRSC